MPEGSMIGGHCRSFGKFASSSEAASVLQKSIRWYNSVNCTSVQWKALTVRIVLLGRKKLLFTVMLFTILAFKTRIFSKGAIDWEVRLRSCRPAAVLVTGWGFQPPSPFLAAGCSDAQRPYNRRSQNLVSCYPVAAGPATAWRTDIASGSDVSLALLRAGAWGQRAEHARVVTEPYAIQKPLSAVGTL